MTQAISEKQREKKIYKITIIGGATNLLLLIGKFFAGIVGHSGAMIADAVHSLSDFLTDVVVLIFVNVSAKPRDESHDYGHGKFETLATTIIAVALFVVGMGIVVKSATSIAGFVNGKIPARPGLIAFIAAVVSIVVKESLYWYTYLNGKKLNSSAVIANAWHHRSDALSSIATMVGIGCAYFLGDKWTIMDPVSALIVGVLIFKVSYDLFVPAINELLEKSLPKDVEDEIMRLITEDPSIQMPHNLRTRRIGSHIAIEIHIRLDAQMTVAESHDITVGVENRLKEKYGNDTFVTVHVEPYQTKV